MLEGGDGLVTPADGFLGGGGALLGRLAHGALDPQPPAEGGQDGGQGQPAGDGGKEEGGHQLRANGMNLPARPQLASTEALPPPVGNKHNRRTSRGRCALATLPIKVHTPLNKEDCGRLAPHRPEEGLSLGAGE